MRVLIALDWSEQAFAAVREASYLYDLHEVVLLHESTSGMFQYPIVAEVSSMQGYDDFRTAMKAGEQLLDHHAPARRREVSITASVSSPNRHR
ncbi:MAG: hypothetical protein MRJ92_01560 [Nitrospira sp.]|nr:hypothetical protein [Nitrospira sp.]